MDRCRCGPEGGIGLGGGGGASNRLSGRTACQMTVVSAPSARDVLPCENVPRDGRKQCNVRFRRQSECGITNAQDFRRLGSTLKWQEDRDGSARETFSEPCERGRP